ncbi:hypothetical protein [Sinomicrobium soli]|uniref:hypothetical protein n=1 Tax=Sinomicrobium sp. N-1-3-6 TaxID=2219864 RepID=UPI000DCF133F|nr:hypothetical protein [Sinomicrobium sp. N-1-3-6]RAV29512.1 hypothetical protein DN748_08430 [Sinomicrobium sp. N-1-3-6]
MKNLENYGVKEMKATEMETTNGGLSIGIGIGGVSEFLTGALGLVLGAVGGAVTLVSNLLNSISVSASAE